MPQSSRENREPGGGLRTSSHPLAALGQGVKALFRRPSLLVAGTVLMVCVPTADTDVSRVSVTPADLAVVVLAAVTAVRALADVRVLVRGGWLPFAAVLISIAAATIGSADPVASLPGFVRHLELFVVVPVAVVAAVADRRDLMVVGGAFVAAALLEGAVGSWQYLTGTGASFGGQDLRAVGTFGALDVLAMATVLSFGVIIALAMGLTVRGRHRRLGLFAVAVGLLAPLAFSLSRGSWIACAAGMTVVLLVASRVLTGLVVLACLALAVVLIGGFQVGSDTVAKRVQSVVATADAPDRSVTDRYALWQTATRMWGDHQLTGVGLRNFPAFRDSYAPLSLSSGSDVADPRLGYQREPLLSPHNMYLLVLSEQGLLGMVAFGGLFVALAVAAFRWHPVPYARRHYLDLAAPALLVWVLVDFCYADLGGPASVLVSVLLGLVASRGLSRALVASRGLSRALVADRPAVPLAATEANPPAPLPGPRLAPVRLGRAGRPVHLGRAGRSAHPPVVRAAMLTAVLTAVGFAFGFGRDLLLAHYFGATGGTDAFVVAWTVPETVAPLLIEGALAYLLIPMFSRALVRGEDVREVMGATLWRMTAVLVALAAGLAADADRLVAVLAPGVREGELAATCTRLVCVTVVTFGLAGYLSAALRAHHVFGPPAAIYVAYNVGIVAFMAVLHGRLGVASAALGVAGGSALMVAVQLPTFLRRVGPPRPAASPAAVAALGSFTPIAVFMLARQAQVLVERFAGSSLSAGTIAHLNFAQKISQVPMVLTLVATTVTFPALARARAAGDTGKARRRLEWDLRLTSAVVLLATAFLVVFAPVVVRILFQHGQFLAADTDATAAIIRVYVLGLLGHALVSTLSRAFFAGRAGWYPVALMTAGLAITATLAAALTEPFGATGIAVANAAGITATALLMVRGLRREPGAVPPAVLAAAVARLAVAAGLAAAAGAAVAAHLPRLPDPVLVATGGLVVATVFVAVAALMGSPEVRVLTSRIGARSR